VGCDFAAWAVVKKFPQLWSFNGDERLEDSSFSK